MSAARLCTPGPSMYGSPHWHLLLLYIWMQSGFRPLAALSYNDCNRRGSDPVPPDPETVPIWSGDPATFFDDYRPLKDVHQYMEQLQAGHSEFMTLRQIGKSWQGSPLRVAELTIGTGSEEKPCIFFMGGIHAREWLAVSTVLYLASELAHRAKAEAGQGPVSAALRQFVFVFLAPANPDGYVYSWEANRWWRKTRSNRLGESCGTTSDGVGGVDANRNWGYTRGKTNDAAYKTELGLPCADDFMGPAAFSEPETKAIAEYMQQRQERAWRHGSTDANGNRIIGSGYVAAFIDYHSFGMLMLPPWSYSGSWPPSPDKEYISKLTNSMVAAVNGASGANFAGGPALLRPDPGTGPDWALGKLGVRATMTIELEGGPSLSNQSFGFCPPKEYIRPTGKEQWAGLEALVQYIQTYGGEPSKLFGLHVKRKTPLPPSSPCAISKKYAAMASISWAKQPSGVTVMVSALAVLLLLSVATSVACRRRRTALASIDEELGRPVSACPQQAVE